jgi:DNA-directed RNA polymerase specialized sigma24 family protein
MRGPNENHMSYREIAAVLGCIWQTVMVIERHALEKLACMLQ